MTFRDEMIERVARALYAAHHRSGDPDYIAKSTKRFPMPQIPNWAYEIDDATVAVNAMYGALKERKAAA